MHRWKFWKTDYTSPQHNTACHDVPTGVAVGMKAATGARKREKRASTRILEEREGLQPTDPNTRSQSQFHSLASTVRAALSRISE